MNHVLTPVAACVSTLLLLTLFTGCAQRDIARAKDAVPHQPPEPPHRSVAVRPEAPAPLTPAAPAPPLTPAQPPSPPPDTQNHPSAGFREAFPHVRVDAAQRVVEFDAIIPINAHDPQKPRTYLEVIACPPDTKEHESVLLTKARPSHVHAALLLIGLEPGSPGAWAWEGEKLEARPPTGPRLSVSAAYRRGGVEHTANPADWVLDINTGRTLADSEQGGAWLFAGSQLFKRQGQEHYRADADGTLIGLHTFGGETVAWSRMYNPDSGLEEPRWIANAATIPPYDTPIVVRIKRAD